MPDLDELAGFDPGTPTPLLPPSEIRRRGDRRRRTTRLAVAGAALAAAVAVGAPAALLSGGGDGRDVQPAPPVPSVPSGDVDWVTAVPADFPFTSGFPDEDATPSDLLAEDPSPTVACGSEGFSGFTDNRVVAYQGESSEDRQVRVLAVYPDAAAAEAQLTELRSALDGCGPFPLGEGTTRVWETVDADLGTEESFAFAEQVHHDDGLVSDLTLFLVGRTGNAIYLTSAYTAAGNDQVVAQVEELLTTRSAAPLESMCLFAEHPCVIESTAAPSGAGAADDVPDGFPLGLGFETGADESVTGPSATINGVSFADVCQTGAWPGSGGTDRLAVRLEGIEYSVTRELVTYDTAEQASSVLGSLSDAVAACPEDENRLFRTLDADTGYESSLTFGYTYREGLGGARFQVVRVGRSVLATVETGEFGPDSLAAGVPTLTEDNRQVTDLMRCYWAEDGC